MAVLELFRERELPATVFACALVLERNLPLASAIRDTGFDICAHGWRWIEHYKLNEEQEREHFRKAVESLATLFGTPPPGWYCRVEGKNHPKMMSVGLHMRVIGHPARAAGLARFLDYVAGLSDVWVCRRIEIARHWAQTRPYDARTAFAL